MRVLAASNTVLPGGRRTIQARCQLISSSVLVTEESFVRIALSPCRGLVAVLVSGLLSLMLILSMPSAQAQAVQHAPFAAQAQKAGLTPVEAHALQSRADGYVSQLGGTQTALNRIQLPGGATIALALPGETYARTAEGASLAAGPACPYTYFCAYFRPNFTSDVMMFTECGSNVIPWSSTGSWINNQTPGTRAKFLSSDGIVRWTDPGAYDTDDSADWSWVAYLKPC